MNSLRTSLKGRLDIEAAGMLRQTLKNNEFIDKANTLSYNDFLSNKLILIAAIRTGIPYSFFSVIQEYLPFNDQDWADFLDLSTKSLLRYKQTSRQFKPNQTEKILEIAEVTNCGLEVLGSHEVFKRWLDTPNFALGNFKPIQLIKDSYGKEMVIAELTRINHGIFI